MLVRVSVAVPELVSVTFCAALGVFTVWLAKLRLAVDKVTAGAFAAVPVPVKLTVCGLPLALSVMVIVPGCEPVVVGVNVTLMVQFAPAATEAPQVLVCVYFALAAMLVMVSAAVPGLVSVTVCAALGVLTVWLPNAR